MSEKVSRIRKSSFLVSTLETSIISEASSSFLSRLTSKVSSAFNSLTRGSSVAPATNPTIVSVVSVLDALSYPVYRIDYQGCIHFKNDCAKNLWVSDSFSPKQESALDLFDHRSSARLRNLLQAFKTDNNSTVEILQLKLKGSQKEGVSITYAKYDMTLTREVGSSFLVLSLRSSLEPATITSRSSPEDILRSVNHHARSPLLVAMAALDELQLNMNKEKSSKRLLQQVKCIRTNMVKMESALNNIVMDNSIDDGTIKLSCEDIDYSDFINDVVTSAREQMPVNYEPPEAQRICRVDRAKLKHTINSLLDEISVACRRVAIELKLSYAEGNADVNITLPDGRPLGANSTCWSRARAVVHLHGGFIDKTVGNEKSPFACELQISLPIQLASASSSSFTTKPVSEKVVSDLPVRVLIVDDVETCRKVISHRLKKYLPDIQIDQAVDGKDAVAKIIDAISSGVEYDAVTMDFTMPTLNGDIATKMIRAAGYRGKIYGATGNVLQQDIDLFMSSGTDRVFCKPLKDTDYNAILAFQ